MSAKPVGLDLSKAAINGAVIGPFIIFLNIYFGGQLATTRIFDLATMLVGGAFGGAVLFLGIALFLRFLARRVR